MDTIKCIKCGFDCSDYNEPNYCPKCGTTLYNYCPSCNPNGITDYEDDTQVLPSNDPFCTICGSETILHDIIIDNQN